MTRLRMTRRSDSSWVSPGPRVPMPPPRRSRWLHCPTSRGSRYESWASSTWSCPSLVRARWAKMSRMSAVRSMTRKPSAWVRLRSWTGDSASSEMSRLASRLRELPDRVGGSLGAAGPVHVDPLDPGLAREPRPLPLRVPDRLPLHVPERLGRGRPPAHDVDELPVADPLEGREWLVAVPGEEPPHLVGQALPGHRGRPSPKVRV